MMPLAVRDDDQLPDAESVDQDPPIGRDPVRGGGAEHGVPRMTSDCSVILYGIKHAWFL